MPVTNFGPAMGATFAGMSQGPVAVDQAPIAAQQYGALQRQNQQTDINTQGQQTLSSIVANNTDQTTGKTDWNAVNSQTMANPDLTYSQKTNAFTTNQPIAKQQAIRDAYQNAIDPSTGQLHIGEFAKNLNATAPEVAQQVLPDVFKTANTELQDNKQRYNDIADPLYYSYNQFDSKGNPLPYQGDWQADNLRAKTTANMWDPYHQSNIQIFDNEDQWRNWLQQHASDAVLKDVVDNQRQNMGVLNKTNYENQPQKAYAGAADGMLAQIADGIANKTFDPKETNLVDQFNADMAKIAENNGMTFTPAKTNADVKNDALNYGTNGGRGLLDKVEKTAIKTGAGVGGKAVDAYGDPVVPPKQQTADEKMAVEFGKALDPLVASSRSGFGQAGVNNQKATRALDVLNRQDASPDDISLAVDDLLSVMKSGSPDAEMLSRGYNNSMQMDVQKKIGYYLSDPQVFNNPTIKNHLKEVISGIIMVDNESMLSNYGLVKESYGDWVNRHPAHAAKIMQAATNIINPQGNQTQQPPESDVPPNPYTKSTKTPYEQEVDDAKNWIMQNPNDPRVPSIRSHYGF